MRTVKLTCLPFYWSLATRLKRRPSLRTISSKFLSTITRPTSSAVRVLFVRLRTILLIHSPRWLLHLSFGAIFKAWSLITIRTAQEI